MPPALVLALTGPQNFSITTYWYVMDVASNGFDAKDLQQRVEQRMCANEEIRHAISDRGFSYEYHYANKAQTVLAAFTIAKCVKYRAR
jgi:hypothetical protein